MQFVITRARRCEWRNANNVKMQNSHHSLGLLKLKCLSSSQMFERCHKSQLVSKRERTNICGLYLRTTNYPVARMYFLFGMNKPQSFDTPHGSNKNQLSEYFLNIVWRIYLIIKNCSSINFYFHFQTTVIFNMGQKWPLFMSLYIYTHVYFLIPFCVRLLAAKE